MGQGKTNMPRLNLGARTFLIISRKHGSFPPHAVSTFELESWKIHREFNCDRWTVNQRSRNLISGIRGNLTGIVCIGGSVLPCETMLPSCGRTHRRVSVYPAFRCPVRSDDLENPSEPRLLGAPAEESGRAFVHPTTLWHVRFISQLISWLIIHWVCRRVLINFRRRVIRRQGSKLAISSFLWLRKKSLLSFPTTP